ncbi:MAG TPA: BTAD domain-containing putative transcriptional regulator [Streptosporangiaceae bacterium]|nr:BTAD domain-containing putative transcriptional regulator [Streptosporangiaceae bacterium]
MSMLTEGAERAGPFPAQTAGIGRPRKADAADGSPARAEVVQIRLLGRFTVLRGQEEIPLRVFGGRLPQQLLRLLAMRRGTLVPKDMIADALWPRRPPADPRGNIEVLVSRIRRALGDPALIRTGPAGYSLTEGRECRVDAEAFLAAAGDGRRLLADSPAQALACFRDALELWRGEPLAEDTYADWAQPDRRCLSLALTDVLDGAAAAALACGDPASAGTWAERATAREPLREASAMLAVRALDAGGDPAGALAAFDSFRGRLAGEAGLAPSPEALELRQRVSHGRAPPPEPGQAGVTAARPAEPVPLTGRKEERTAPLPAATERGSPLAGLPGRARELLVLLALLGRPAPPALLAQASGRTLREVLDGLDELARAGLAQPGPDGWDHAHQPTAHAVTRTPGPARTARAHLLLAQALEHRNADAAEIAAHLAAGGDRAGAAAAYAAAAALRLERRECDEAIRLAETGLGLDAPPMTRAGLLRARAEARLRRGLLAGARDDLAAALANSASPAGRSRILAELAILEAPSASLARGEELAELAIAEAGNRPEALGQALAAGAVIDLPAGNLARAGRRLRRARNLLEHSGDVRGQARVLYWQAMIGYMAGRLREAAARLADLADLPVTPGEVLWLWSPRATRGHVLAFLGEPQAGLTEIEATFAWAQAARYPVVQSECLWRRSEALAFAGRAGEAAESAEQALAIATGIRHAACTAAALRGLGIAWETAGKPDRAEDAFRQSVRAAEANPFFGAWASARLGACLARQGRPLEAAPHVRAALSAGPPLTRYEARWAHAELLAAQDDDQACHAAADALRAAEKGGYLILLPRLRELAGL